MPAGGRALRGGRARGGGGARGGAGVARGRAVGRGTAPDCCHPAPLPARLNIPRMWALMGRARLNVGRAEWMVFGVYVGLVGCVMIVQLALSQNVWPHEGGGWWVGAHIKHRCTLVHPCSLDHRIKQYPQTIGGVASSGWCMIWAGTDVRFAPLILDGRLDLTSPVS